MKFIIVIIVVLLMCVALAKFFLNLIFGKRCEGNANFKYFTSDDFDELEAKPIEVKSNKGQLLRGNIYTNRNVKNYKGIIVFVHGMGAGHLSYTTEINTFAKAGFIVLGYDNTGTCASEGKKLKGFFQAVIDLKYILKYVEDDVELKKYKLYLVGHSWGAYTACTVLQFNPRVKSVVAFSGINDTSKLLCNIITSKTKINFNFLKPFMDFVNIITFGKESTKPVAQILKDVKVPVLLLHGNSDDTVNLENSIVGNKTIFEENKYVRTICYEDRLHNVYQTKESEKYLNSVFSELSELKKKYKGEDLKQKADLIYKNIDYKKITEEDENIMKVVLDFLM